MVSLQAPPGEPPGVNAKRMPLFEDPPWVISNGDGAIRVLAALEAIQTGQIRRSLRGAVRQERGQRR